MSGALTTRDLAIVFGMFYITCGKYQDFKSMYPYCIFSYILNLYKIDLLVRGFILHNSFDDAIFFHDSRSGDNPIRKLRATAQIHQLKNVFTK